uniref:Truncated envelope glycoprotein n=1 Tax=Porcine reproductive and respiratory syndrome virus TaxID=28344 RepID=Q8QQU6_PRRSV|nr:truncated envelope glycoprotein [Porcine reproductive and respiratory syndrome virus]
MRCSHKLGRFLNPRFSLLGGFFLCTGLSWSFAEGNGNSSTYQYIYDLPDMRAEWDPLVVRPFCLGVRNLCALPGCNSYSLTGFSHNKSFF